MDLILNSDIPKNRGVDKPEDDPHAESIRTVRSYWEAKCRDENGEISAEGAALVAQKVREFREEQGLK